MNKINKKSFSPFWNSTKKSEGFRVIYKSRNNYKEKVQKQTISKRDKESMSSSRLTPIHP